MISSWQTFVAAVQRGYGDSIYDYANDMSVRDRIAQVLGEVSFEVRAALEPGLVVIDARFAEATASSTVSIPGATGKAWWWWRVPLRLEADLRADLESEQILND
jgi:hypothetical protein